MRLLIVMTGREHPELAAKAIDSVTAQARKPDGVCLVDDASTDTRMRGLLRYAALEYGWEVILNDEREYVLANQVKAWKQLEPKDEDVIIFVDLDDQLAHEKALGIVEDAYRDGAWLTYGSYVPEPSSHPGAIGCRPALMYPEYVFSGNLFRSMVPHFNHLRTISWRVLKHLTDEDLHDDYGESWQANADASVMIPCLELAGMHTSFIPDVLYKYTCNSPDAVWRTQRERLESEWRQLRARKPRMPLDDRGKLW